MSITREVVERVDELTRTGLSIKAAAKSLGLSFNGVKSAAERYGIKLERMTLVDRVMARADEIRASDKTQKWWATELGTFPSAIGHAFKAAGVTTKRRRQPSPTKNERLLNYRRVIAYITANGGYLPDALRALGLTLTPQPIREFARSIGFDFSHYQFAWQKHGHWLTLPGAWERRAPSDYLVPSMCTLCSEISHVSMINLKMQQSTRCHKCSPGNNSKQAVVNAVTGESYRSIMAWAREIGHLKSYQRLRITLINKGCITVDGVEYSMPSFKHKDRHKKSVVVDVLAPVASSND
ncbi:hypothetical protein OAE83_00950 [bacterium]|nr:hypothetical protein [bacterium]